MTYCWDDGTSLYHYGVRGQRWGNRRYQDANGQLTEEGRRHYGIFGRRAGGGIGSVMGNQRTRANRSSKSSNAKRKETLKKAVMIGGAAIATGLAAYGAYRLGSDVATQHKLNKQIKAGRSYIERELKLAESFVKSGKGDGTKATTINYIGNDAKRHQARITYNTDPTGQVTGYGYYNKDAAYQKRATLKDVRKIRKAAK